MHNAGKAATEAHGYADEATAAALYGACGALYAGAAMIILSLVVCASVAIFCFASELPLAGFLMLLGMIPGIGYLPLVIAAIILALSSHPVAAVCAVLVIVYNLWVVVALRR